MTYRLTVSYDVFLTSLTPLYLINTSSLDNSNSTHASDKSGGQGVGTKLDKYQQDRNASLTRKRRDAAARAAATAAVKAAMLAADLHADKGSDKLSDLNKVLNWGRSKNSDKGKMNGSGKGSDQGSDKDVDVGAQSPAPGSSQGQGLAQGLTLAPAAMPMRQEPTAAGGGGSGDEEGGTGSGQGRLTRGSMAGVMSGLDRVRRATLDIRNFNITTLMPKARRPTLQIHATAENDHDTPHKAHGQLSPHANSNHDDHDQSNTNNSRRYSTNSTLHGSGNKVRTANPSIAHILSVILHTHPFSLTYS